MSIYHSFGIEPIINVSGTVTRLGGAPMPTAVLDAFCEAATECVPLDQLQGAAARVIAETTGAESGLVTSGAAAALTLGTAAILAGYNLRRIEQLPHCDFPCEFIIPREQRNGYDHAIRAAGARLVEVGFHEIVAGAGVRRCEAWEIEAAIGPQTAGVVYVYDTHGRPPLAEVVAVAHAHNLPVLVDAAGEVPPREHLRSIIATGADLVAISGGKGLRGPQASGILCGRRDLIGSAALQMLDMDDHFELWEPPANLIDKSRLKGMPRHGIGRALKVSKEQIVALLTALRLFINGEYESHRVEMQRHLQRVVDALAGLPVCTRLVIPDDGESAPTLELSVNESRLGRTAFEVCRRLRHSTPPIYVGHGQLDQGRLVIHPIHLNEERTTQLIAGLRGEMVR
jgi:D-glucosaminate-6-phosphate ammonia-lyase